MVDFIGQITIPSEKLQEMVNKASDDIRQRIGISVIENAEDLEDIMQGFNALGESPNLMVLDAREWQWLAFATDAGDSMDCWMQPPDAGLSDLGVDYMGDRGRAPRCPECGEIAAVRYPLDHEEVHYPVQILYPRRAKVVEAINKWKAETDG